MWPYKYGPLVYSPFEYLREDSSVGRTSNPGVRSDFLIDLDLVIFKLLNRKVVDLFLSYIY